jgi:enterochelin esterase-like enzyme
MSTKGTSNTNAQWSADPDRGWVRANERQNLNEKASSSNSVRNHEKQKGKGKGKKS